jgi:hypothetical protein
MISSHCLKYQLLRSLYTHVSESSYWSIDAAVLFSDRLIRSQALVNEKSRKFVNDCLYYITTNTYSAMKKIVLFYWCVSVGMGVCCVWGGGGDVCEYTSEFSFLLVPTHFFLHF